MHKNSFRSPMQNTINQYNFNGCSIVLGIVVPISHSVQPGETVFFDCHMKDFERWTFENKPLARNVIISKIESNVISRLTIDRAKESNNGIYTCHGTNNNNDQVKVQGTLSVIGEINCNFGKLYFVCFINGMTAC